MARHARIRTPYDRAWINLNQRRRKSKLSLFRLAHRMHVRNGMEVFVAIHHHNEDRYRIYTSQPNVDWPPPLHQVEKMYPIPEVWHPGNIEPLYQASPSSHLPQRLETPPAPGPVPYLNRSGGAGGGSNRVDPLPDADGPLSLGQDPQPVVSDEELEDSDGDFDDAESGEDEHEDTMEWGTSNVVSAGTPGTAVRGTYPFVNATYGQPMPSMETHMETAIDVADSPLALASPPLGRRSIVVEIPGRPQLGSPIVFQDIPVSPRTPSPQASQDDRGQDNESPSPFTYDGRQFALNMENLGLQTPVQTPRKPKTSQDATTPRKLATPRKADPPHKGPASRSSRKTAAGEIRRRPDPARSPAVGGVEKTWLTQRRGNTGRFARGRCLDAPGFSGSGTGHL